jgi:hypothetical protein
MTDEINYYSNMSQVENISQLLNIGQLSYYVNNSVDLTNILNYYSNLLIIQYHDLSKAVATIKALCSVLTPINTTTGNLLINDIRDAFNIDTAVGVQLDIIGEYVGVDRFWQGLSLTNGNYFGYIDAYNSDISRVYDCGYTDAYSNPLTGSPYLDADSILSITNKLNDDDYRQLIRLKILQNTSNHSWASLVNGLYAIFGDSVYISTCNNGKMSYLTPSTTPMLIQAMVAKGILPRPMGITISGLIPSLPISTFGYIDAYNPNISNVPICGYYDANVGTIAGGHGGHNVGTIAGGQYLDAGLVFNA